MLCAQATELVPKGGVPLAQHAPQDYLYFDLGCNVDEWEGYFAPDRWQKVYEGHQDEGECLLLSERVQQTDNIASILFETIRSELETWSIEIPAAGYLAFHLRATSPNISGEITVSVNGETATHQLRADGAYYSPFLQAGDVFSLNIPAGSTAYRWSQLRFHTNFTGVIVRPSESAPASRYTPILEGRIQRVYFPNTGLGVWPVFDQDGDPLTTYDQQELRSSTDRFEVEYEDEIIKKENTYYLERTFTIREKCRRGNWLRRSRTWAILPLIQE